MFVLCMGIVSDLCRNTTAAMRVERLVKLFGGFYELGKKKKKRRMLTGEGKLTPQQTLTGYEDND